MPYSEARMSPRLSFSGPALKLSIRYITSAVTSRVKGPSWSNQFFSTEAKFSGAKGRDQPLVRNSRRSPTSEAKSSSAVAQE